MLYQERVKIKNQEKILVVLASEGPKTFGELLEQTKLSKPVLSEHLKNLQKEGRIHKTIRENKIVYELSEKFEDKIKFAFYLTQERFMPKDIKGLVKRWITHQLGNTIKLFTVLNSLINENKFNTKSGKDFFLTIDLVREEVFREIFFKRLESLPKQDLKVGLGHLHKFISETRKIVHGSFDKWLAENPNEAMKYYEEHRKSLEKIEKDFYHLLNKTLKNHQKLIDKN